MKAGLTVSRYGIFTKKVAAQHPPGQECPVEVLVGGRRCYKLNAQPHNPQKQSSNSQLDLAQLVSRANIALDQGNIDDAVYYLRSAVQRAPLRTELRDALFKAIGEQKSRKGSSAAGPRPMRKPAQAPLFDNPIEDENSRAQIEEVPSVKKKRNGAATPTQAQKRPISETQELFAQSDFLGEAPSGSRPQSKPAPESPSRPARRLGEGRPKSARPSVSALFAEARRPARISMKALAMGGAGALLVGGIVTGIFFAVSSGGDDAKLPAEPAMSQSQRDDAVLLARAEDYLKERQYTLAFEQIEKMSEGENREQMFARTYASQADEFFEAKRYEEARRVYAKAAESDTANELWQFQVGWCSYMMGLEKRVTNRQAAQVFFDDAEKAFKATIAINPNQVKALHGLGKIEVARNNRPAANEYYQKVLQIAPDSPEATLAKGDLQAWGLERNQPTRQTMTTTAANTTPVSERPESAPIERPAPEAAREELAPANKPKVKTEMTALKNKL